jgi:membrane-bound lytic murein transglycosylase D
MPRFLEFLDVGLNNKRHVTLATLALMALIGCQNTQYSTSAPINNLPVLPTPVPQAIEVVVEVVKAPTPQEVENLWRRIQMQFALPTTDNRQVTSQLNWYKKHPKYIQRMSKRAEPYLYFIVQEIEKRNMPLEIALLPIVESAFDPFAYSHGAASGMWQIIGDTGKRFGLDQNWWYDGRRDVVASTTAALDYLQFLHRHFKGDWLHALAAYNSGEGRVGRAIKRNRKAGKKTDFWSLKLPTETKDYVPKLLALASLLNNPERYGLHWPIMSNTQQVMQVNTQSQIDLALAARFADMPLKDLYRLNPGFNRWATPPNGNHNLLLPLSKVKKFKAALAKTPKKERLNWTRYKIQSGDSLGTIAQNHRTTSAIIRQINNVSGSNIRAGKYLLIPIASAKLSDYQLSVDSRLKATQSKKRGKIKTTHLVQSGDNLWDLARKYKVSHRSIAKWNGMAPKDRLILGKRLVIWLDENKKTVNSGNKVFRTITYKVRNGDSIARIAQKFNLKIQDVIRWNTLNIKKYLQPGQRLKLKVDVTKITS